MTWSEKPSTSGRVPVQPVRRTAGRRGRDSWQVLVVEDDAVIASLHTRLVARMPMLHSIGVARSGEEALRAVLRFSPDLVLLDLGLPGTDGLSVLREFRVRGYGGEVIVITASRSADAVCATAHFGTLDYLVKPFTPERLRQALAAFLQRMTALRSPELEQESIDHLLRASGGRRWLPRGLSHETLSAVREALASSKTGICADTVADATGMARVTVRRYLEYLVATGEAVSDSDITGPGRPRKLYEARHAT